MKLSSFMATPKRQMTSKPKPSSLKLRSSLKQTAKVSPLSRPVPVIEQEHKIECEENSGKEANKQEHCSCDMERIGEHYGVCLQRSNDNSSFFQQPEESLAKIIQRLCANGPISVAKSLEAQKKRSHAMAKKNMRLLDQNSNTSENPWSVEDKEKFCIVDVPGDAGEKTECKSRQPFLPPIHGDALEESSSGCEDRVTALFKALGLNTRKKQLPMKVSFDTQTYECSFPLSEPIETLGEVGDFAVGVCKTEDGDSKKFMAEYLKKMETEQLVNFPETEESDDPPAQVSLFDLGDGTEDNEYRGEALNTPGDNRLLWEAIREYREKSREQTAKRHVVLLSASHLDKNGSCQNMPGVLDSSSVATIVPCTYASLSRNFGSNNLFAISSSDCQDPVYQVNFVPDSPTFFSIPLLHERMSANFAKRRADRKKKPINVFKSILKSASCCCSSFDDS